MDVNWTGDRWPSSHGIKTPLPTDRGGFMAVKTFCGLQGLIDPALISDHRPARKTCETCLRNIASRVTT